MNEQLYESFFSCLEPPPVLSEPSNVITEQEDDPFTGQSLTTQPAAPFTSVSTLAYWEFLLACL